MCGLHLSGLFKPFVIDPDPGLPLTCACAASPTQFEMQNEVLDDRVRHLGNYDIPHRCVLALTLMLRKKLRSTWPR